MAPPSGEIRHRIPASRRSGWRVAGGHLAVTSDRVAFVPNRLEAARRDASWSVGADHVRAVRLHHPAGAFGRRFPWLAVVTDAGTEVFRSRRVRAGAEAVASVAGVAVEQMGAQPVAGPDPTDLWADRRTVVAVAAILAFVPLAAAGLALHAGSAALRPAGEAVMVAAVVLLASGSVLAGVSARAWRRRRPAGAA